MHLIKLETIEQTLRRESVANIEHLMDVFRAVSGAEIPVASDYCECGETIIWGYGDDYTDEYIHVNTGKCQGCKTIWQDTYTFLSRSSMVEP